MALSRRPVLVDTPEWFSGSGGNSGSGGKGGGTDISQTRPFWALVFVCGQLPAALGAVYQEHVFREAKVNVVYMLAWASLFQFVFLLCAAPLNFVPHFGGVSAGAFGAHMRDAARCFAHRLPGHPECSSAAILLVSCVVSSDKPLG